eukprot:SAG11_NODE_19916_length_456_cov_1.173669_1_plen_24_part_01
MMKQHTVQSFMQTAAAAQFSPSHP